MIAQTVHTTGINWQSLLVTVAAIAGIISIVGGYVVRSLSKTTKETILQVIASEVTPVLTEIQGTLRNHSTRIAKLEGIEEGKAQAIAAAAVTTTK